jgi:hypothetical protein
MENNNEAKKDKVFCLTFEEIKKLHEETQKHIESNDYGFAPIMMIKIKFDTELEEKEYISTTCMHEFTKATAIKKEYDNIPWVDITDEDKFDFI